MADSGATRVPKQQSLNLPCIRTRSPLSMQCAPLWSYLSRITIQFGVQWRAATQCSTFSILTNLTVTTVVCKSRAPRRPSSTMLTRERRSHNMWGTLVALKNLGLHWAEWASWLLQHRCQWLRISDRSWTIGLWSLTIRRTFTNQYSRSHSSTTLCSTNPLRRWQ